MRKNRSKYGAAIAVGMLALIVDGSAMAEDTLRHGTDDLDQFASILLPDGTRCHFDSVTRIDDLSDSEAITE